jgi:hypothetical protein
MDLAIGPPPVVGTSTTTARIFWFLVETVAEPPTKLSPEGGGRNEGPHRRSAENLLLAHKLSLTWCLGLERKEKWNNRYLYLAGFGPNRSGPFNKDEPDVPIKFLDLKINHDMFTL